MRPRRLLTAVFAAFLLVCGVPAVALAETNVVLSNESEGTEVTTGEATFTNSENSSSDSTTFGAGDSESIANQTAGDVRTGVPSSGQVSGALPSSASASAPTAEDIEAEQARTESVEALFVGFSIPSGSISP